MHFSKTNSLSIRILSTFLICVLFLNDLIPFSRACNSLMTEKFQFGTMAFSSNKIDLLRNSVNTELLEKMKEIQHEVDITESVQSTKQSNRVSTGPNQSETSGFSINSTDGMVDKFTGDFSYSIPLMDVEGYPITLSYNSNVGMNSEASWVGLGWDLSVGAVSREMRGIPDEFNGEQNITREYHQKDYNIENGWKTGVFGGISPKWGSKYNLSAQITLLGGGYKNSYLGKGVTFDFGITSGFSVGDKTYFAPSFGTGFSIDTKNGVGSNHSFGFGIGKTDGSKGMEISYGGSYNSRNGVTDKMLSLGLSTLETEGDYRKGKEVGVGSSISFGTATNIPRVTFNETGFSDRLDLSAYFAVKDVKSRWKVGGKIITYSSASHIDGHEILQPAIGYLHSGKRNQYTNNFPVMDFNRATDFAFSEEMSNLSFSYQTYDFFHVNAMGVSGQFRANRNDYGSYYDPIGKSEFDGINKEIEVGFQNNISLPLSQEITLGVSAGTQTAGTQSSSWVTSSGNPIDFTSESKGNSFDNSVYFKSVGEPTQISTDALTMLGGEVANRFVIEKNVVARTLGLTTDLVNEAGNLNTINSTAVNASNQKPVIATVFKPIIAAELTNSAAYYFSHDENVFYSGSLNQLNRVVAGFKVNNHISKLEVVSTDGVKYSYGIPVYNKFYDEVSFSCGGLSVNSDSKLVIYNAGDNSVTNTLGRSNLYDKTTMPAFAHSFLLTEMTSSDYIDRTSNGPSLDDMGSYYKFNYTQSYGELNTTEDFYKWRFPVSGGTANEAMLNKGFEGTDADDIANYTYGEKEIWYTHSIESKNLVAEFYLKDRYDAYGVQDENGLLDLNQPLKCIDKIVLYNRSERLEKGANAKPLQTVYFEYDYSLCKNSPSNKFSYAANLDLTKSGKLTLKAIRVQTGISVEMKLSKYEFIYPTTSEGNPNFNYANVDGWGNIKVNDVNKPNDVNPYAVQDKTTANTNSGAWKMNQIINPMGGVTEIEYEADRYAFVQSERAMKHMDIHGMTNLVQFLYLQTQTSWNGTDYVNSDFTSNLNLIALTNFFNAVNYSWAQLNFFWATVFEAQTSIKGGAKYTQKYGKFVEKLTPNNVIVFELDEEIGGANTIIQAGDSVKNNYFKKSDNTFLKELYFRMHVDVTTDVKELVQTFATISEDQSDPFDNLLPYEDDFSAIGVMPKDPTSGKYKYGYVVLEPVNSGEKESKSGDDKEEGGSLTMHPLQKTSLEYVRQNLPDKIYGSCEDCNTNLSIDWKAFFGGDIYKAMIEKGHYVESYYNDYSTMRLFVEDSVKYASTGRVKKITYKDKWDVISGEAASIYNWNYIYTLNDQNTGVACYEPRSSRDENSLYNWETFIDTKKKFPDETKFSTLKIADPLYPSPIIGYSAVKVLFENSEAKGYSISEFYTSKDKPTFEDNTDIISPEKIKKIKPLTGESLERYGFSQGYIVKTNDFHGKPQVSSVYDRFGNLQVRSTYNYYELGEKQKMLDRNGVVREESIALEYDIHNDSRFVVDSSEMWLFGLELTLRATSSFVPPFIPLIYFVPNFYKTSRKRGFYSTCMVKHINQSAQLKSIETQNMMSINSAENLVFDKYTGNVLLSSLKDEFNDTLYSFNYPAHWYYEQFRELNNVEDFSVQGSIASGVFSISGTQNLTNSLVPGDIIQITNGTTTESAWVLEVNTSNVSLIESNGTVYSGLSGGSITLTIIKSNRKNRINETMKGVITKKEPIIVSSQFTFPESEIISSSVITHNDRNNLRCTGRFLDKGYNEVLVNEVVNPFLFGAKGDLVMESQFAWQSERINDQHAHGIRFDGTYTDYFPFYKLNATDQKWYRINETSHPNYLSTELYRKWRNLGKVKTFDEYAKPLESVDQLNVFSSVLYGYHHGLTLVPTAQAVNAKQQDIAFDGFEDYNYFSTVVWGVSETHFDFTNILSTDVLISSEQKHSGLASLKVLPNHSAYVKKKVANECLHEVDGIDGGFFKADSCLCIKPFEPTPGDYVVSLWVKENTSQSLETYSNAKVSITIDANSPQIFTASGPILDGWQRIEGNFTIPTNATTIKVGLVNSGTTSVYFDDLRLHPFLAGMTTVVYDPKTLLPMATHDGYNFTTFYNYDENLNQVRIRVETVEGIKTVSESEFSGQKQF